MSIVVFHSHLYECIQFSKSLYGTISCILKLWGAPKQTENYESVSFIEFAVRCLQTNDFNAEQRSQIGVTTQDRHEFETIAKRINEQRQHVVNLLQTNIPLIKARHMELEEKRSKSTAAAQDGAVEPLISHAQLDAEEISALFRLTGYAGARPVVKYEKVLEDANASMNSQPVIDSTFVQQLTLIGHLKTIEEPLAEMLRVAEECERCAREVGAATCPK